MLIGLSIDVINFRKLFYMKIYTKTGDKGETSLLGGKRISKCCVEMEAIGGVDELNASLGLLLSFFNNENKFSNIKKQLLNIQNNLFVIGSNLAAVQTDLNKVPKLNLTSVSELEKWIDKMESELPKLTQFILPGGDLAAAQSFYARAICRRAERQIIRMGEKYELDSLVNKYINRLSDYLFVLGRFINREVEVDEIKWVK